MLADRNSCELWKRESLCLHLCHWVRLWHSIREIAKCMTSWWEKQELCLFCCDSFCPFANSPCVKHDFLLSYRIYFSDDKHMALHRCWSFLLTNMICSFRGLFSMVGGHFSLSFSWVPLSFFNLQWLTKLVLVLAGILSMSLSFLKVFY